MKPRTFAARLFPKPRTIRHKPATKNREAAFLGSRLEQLEDRITPVANIWTGVTSLNWSIDTNWSLGHTPTSAEDVEISNGNSVTHSANADAVHKISITGGSTLALSGGSITDSTDLDASSGNFRLSGGLLAGATVLGGTTITATTSGGTLAGVTLQGTLDATSTSGVGVTVTGGLTLDGGTVLIGSNTGSYAVVSFDGGNQTLGGSGSVVFGSYTGFGNTLWTGKTAGTNLTIGPGILIHGQNGVVGTNTNFWGGSSNASFTNQGTINADVAGGTIRLDGTNWSNSGSAPKGIQVATGAAVTLAGSWTNAGTIAAAAGSTLNLGGAFATAALGAINAADATVNLTGTLTNTGQTLALNATTNSWRLLGGTIDGGTVSTADGKVLAGTTSGGFLTNNVTINGTLDVTTASGTSVTVTGGLTLDGGTVLIGSNTGSYAVVSFDGGNQTLGGSGSVVFGSYTGFGNTLWTGKTAGTNLTIGPGILIHGQNGVVGTNTNFWGGSSNASFTNQGTINADVAGGTIRLDGTNWSNSGSAPKGIQVATGAAVTLAGSWTNAGTIAAAAGSTLNLGGAFATAALGAINAADATVNLTGTLTNTGQTLALNATTNSWRLLGGTIDGGTVSTADGKVLAGTTSGGFLTNNVTINGTLDATSTSGVGVTVTGGLTLDGGTVLIGSNTGSYAVVSFDGGNQTLGGSGSVVFGSYTGFGNTLWTGKTAGTNLTIGPGILIHGQNGVVGTNTNFWGGSSNASFTNQGTINADVAGGTIRLDGTNWSNSGSAPKGIQVATGAAVTLAGSWTNAGTIAAAAGSTLNLGGTFSVGNLGTITSAGATVNLTGILTNTGNTLTLDSPWRLLGGTVAGGTLATTGGAALSATTSGGFLTNGVTLNGTLDLTSANGVSVTITGGLTLGSGVVLQIGSNAGSYAMVSFDGGNQTLGGDGSVLFGSSVNNTLWTGQTAGTNLTIGPDILIHGQNGVVGTNTNFWGGSSNASFTNQGTINADVAGGSIKLDGTNWSNSGSAPKGIQVATGAAVTLAGSWTNSGAISAANGATVNLGGTFNFATIGTINSAGATVNLTGIMTNTGNTLTMDGPWRLVGGTIIGGTLAAFGNNALIATNSGGTLNGVTLDGTGAGNNDSPLDMQTNVGAVVSVSGGLTLKGAVLRLGNAANTTYGQLSFTGATQTIDGASGAGNAGTIVFGPNGSNGIFLSTGLPVVTFGANLTITGASGLINTGSVAFDNLATITADPTAMGLGLTSGTITLAGTKWTNHGTIGAQNGGTLSLDGFRWSNSGTIALNTSNATVILGGTITTSDLGTFTRPGGTGGTTRLTASLINVGATLHLGAAPTPGSWEITSGRITGGTLSAAAGSALVVVGGGLIAGNVTLDGTGAGDNPTPLVFNNTTVQVDVQVSSIVSAPTGATQSGSTVTITTSTPHGLVVGHNVVIAGVGVAGYNGTFAITSVPTPTTFTYTGAPGLAASGGGTAIDPTLGGLTLKGAVLQIGNATGTTMGQLVFGGSLPQAIDGAAGNPGTVLFGGNASNILSSNSSTLTFGPNLTITGATGLINTTSVAFNNLGTIAADPAAVGLVNGTITLSGTNWTNSGAINAKNGGTLHAQGTTTNFAAGTLTGGTWQVFGGSTLRLINSGVTTNAANIVLDGANSNFFRDAGTTNALAAFGANSAAGSFTIQNGRNFTSAGAVSNVGSLTIGLGSTFTLAAGNYTQTGGTTTVNGGLSATGLDFLGGVVQGSGTITGNMADAGQVSPGVSPGMLTVNGNYLQAGAGALNIEIGGLSAGAQFDQLSVGGAINLAGALNTSMIGGFVPAVGDAFRILDQTGSGTVGGTFAGLPEGATFFADSVSRFHITYVGGTGNDIVLTAINIAPTLHAIPDPSAILEDAGLQTINLSGIAAGGVESQTLTVTATSSNPALIPNPTVNYTSPNATGSLSYKPVANQSGTSVITVTVTDNGGTALAGINTFTRTFTVTVTPVNDAPTLNAITDPAPILEDAALQTINLTGIAAGGSETQTLTVTATSSNPALIPNPAVTYTSPNATGSLPYKPVSNLSGTAVITVTVTDNGGTANGGLNTTTRTFTVVVTAVNDAPTLDTISDPPPILEDAGQQTINLTGISAGGGETQTLTVAATSSNPALIANPTVTYTSPNATGSLSYTPSGNLSGSAIITVTVTDTGGTANGGINTFVRTFTVAVAPYNHELVSSVKPLPAVTAPSFPVTWSGSVTSGTSVLAAFDILVSTDGGSFTLWQHNTTATSAVFAGELGKDYRFSSVAIDATGGRERPPITPDAETHTALFQRDLASISEDSKNPAGVAVSSLLGTAMTDADSGALRGLAVTGVSGKGTWQFSTDGITWKALTGASEDAAWLLPDSYKVRFLPAANSVGAAGLVFRGWDRTWGVAGKTIAIVAGEPASPVSEAGGFAQVTVTPVNDRPVLPATPAPRLLPTSRSPAVPVGQAASALVRAATDVDGDILGAAVIAKTGAGEWQFSLNGGSTWTSLGNVSATSAPLLGPTDLVRFVPTAGATGSATLTVKAWDRTSGQSGDRVNTTVVTNLALSTGTSVATSLINGAPTLSGTNPTLTMPEDQSPNSGFLVSVLIAGRFADDAGALQGIAVTAADGLGHGAWQYSTNGTTWTALGAVSNTAAILLRSTDRVHFVPNADFNGSAAATLTFKAWDQTSGTAGTVADVSTFVAGTFFSSASLTASLNITSVADRPVVDTSVAPALASFLPGTPPSSARILDLLGNRIHDPDSAIGAIAITSTVGAGVWELSLDGGATWSAIGVIPAASGRLLDGDARLRFNPSAAFHGVATIRYRAWDGTGGTVGTIAAIPAASTAFSTLIGAATVAVNVAPGLNPASPIPLPAIAEDAKNPAGATIASLLGSAVSDSDGVTPPKGIAVTALTGASDGTWQFSTDGGVTWKAVGTVSDAAALLLRSADKLRFLPAANFHGQASATYRAWDQTAGAFGKPGDASVNGGSSAFSSASRTATVNVTSVNDAPTTRSGYAKGKIHLPSVAVGTTSPAGVKVEDLVSAGVLDADGDALGIAVSGLTGVTKGQWQYSLDGTNWLSIGTVSATSALLLANTDFIRFVPNAGFNGSAELKFRAWDQTKGAAHSRKPLTSSALLGSLSTTEFVAPVWVDTSPVLSAN